MSIRSFNILLIEDSPADTKLLRTQLRDEGDTRIVLEHVSRLGDGLYRLQQGGIDAVLLDLSLPDAQGLDTFRSLRAKYPGVAVIVLTGLDDQSIAVEAVKTGAQDFLVKGQLQPDSLTRAIRYAIERNLSETRIHELNKELERRILELAELNKELQAANQSLALARDEALHASKLKSDFVAKMSHELRTPISAIIGILEIVTSKSLDEELKQLLGMSFDASNSLLDIINEVLDLYKVEAGKVELEEKEFCPVSLVERAAEVLVTAARQQQVSLTTFIDPALPATLKGDPVRLHQILINLLANAVKSTESGEVVVRASMDAEDDEYVSVRFAVTDTGIGISEKDIQQLFNPFSQVGSRKAGGTGLGLAICKRLVDLMAGQIGVVSKEGKGSTFWFAVRLARPDRATKSLAAQLRALHVSLSNRRVLVVSNSATTRDVVNGYLEATGMRSGSAANAEQALDLLQQAETADDPYAVAIVSIEPADEAIELVREIRANPTLAITRVILVDDLPQKNDDERIFPDIVAARLSKPVKQTQIVQAIEGIVESGSRQKPPEGEGNASRPGNAEGEIILVAEDNQTLRKLFELQLKKLGFVVHTAANGREAVDAASRIDYSLILMDIQMPELSGIEATRAIRLGESATGKHVPIVAVTASATASLKEGCLAAGMDDYLTKPINLENLTALMRRWTSKGSGKEARK